MIDAAAPGSRAARGPLGWDARGDDEAPARLGSARYGYTFKRFLLVADLTAISLATALTVGLLELIGRESHDPSELMVLAASIPIWVLFAHIGGLYYLSERKIDHSVVDEFGPVFITTTVWTWLFQVVTVVALSNSPTVLSLGLLWATVIALVLALRAVSRVIARSRTWFRRSVVLIGDAPDADKVLRRIARHPEWGLDPVATATLGPDQTMKVDRLTNGGVPATIPIARRNGARQTVDDLAGALAGLEVDRVIVTGGPGSLGERTELVRRLTERQYCVDYVSGEPEALYSSAVLHHLEGLPILTVQPTRISRGSELIKRGMDIILAAGGLVLMSPALAFAAVRIKQESAGPALFRQLRVGRGGQVFKLLKFRTMVEGAEEMRASVADRRRRGNAMLKVRDDPRVTPFGAILRRWSLDELPQLWNVLRGDMSLVGPRPLILDEARLVTDHFTERMRVRPGITGPWQIQGRSDIPFEDMIKLDYTYVVSWSLREDLRLLFKTLASVSRGQGAY